MKGNKAFVNEFDLDFDVIDKISKNSIQTNKENLNVGDLSFRINNLLTDNEVDRIMEQIDKYTWEPVGIDGFKKNYTPGDPIGSYRLSCYEVGLADALWNRIKKYFPKVRVMKDDTPTDWDGHRLWEPIGVNPLFRFIRYTEKGMLIPHYDIPYIQDGNIRTLSSFVVYLSNNSGGGTRFIKDKQVKLPLNERDYSDWKFEPDSKLILFKVNPSKGDAIVFDHRVLHDGERIRGQEIKTIIRTDIMYRKA